LALLTWLQTEQTAYWVATAASLYQGVKAL